MSVLGTICCDIPGCPAKSQEPAAGEGWKNWGQIQGIALNGVPNPHLCPEHLTMATEFIAGLDKK